MNYTTQIHFLNTNYQDNTDYYLKIIFTLIKNWKQRRNRFILCSTRDRIIASVYAHRIWL
jgi:hypothetical protein